MENNYEKFDQIKKFKFKRQGNIRNAKRKLSDNIVDGNDSMIESDDSIFDGMASPTKYVKLNNLNQNQILSLINHYFSQKLSVG